MLNPHIAPVADLAAEEETKLLAAYDLAVRRRNIAHATYAEAAEGVAHTVVPLLVKAARAAFPDADALELTEEPYGLKPATVYLGDGTAVSCDVSVAFDVSDWAARLDEDNSRAWRNRMHYIKDPSEPFRAARHLLQLSPGRCEATDNAGRLYGLSLSEMS
ncbi:hypothetical protein AB0H73_18840 [Streptomyces olivoreticuli]